MITFTLSAINCPINTAYWYATWYVPGVNTSYSGWLKPTDKVIFSGVADTADLYVTAYDGKYVVLADKGTWGKLTLKDGGEYLADFATRKVLEKVAPPVAAEYRNLKAVFNA